MVFGDGRKDRRVITINEEVRYDLGLFDDFSEKATESSTNYLISQFSKLIGFSPPLRPARLGPLSRNAWRYEG